MHFLNNEHNFITEIALGEPKKWTLRQIKDNLFALTISGDDPTFHLDKANEILNELQNKGMHFTGKFLMDDEQYESFMDYISKRDKKHSYFPISFSKGTIQMELVREYNKKDVIGSIIIDNQHFPSKSLRWTI